MPRFLLDTNLLLGFAREAPWAIRTRAEFNLGDRETMVFTSIICRGEILALAEKNGWGGKKVSGAPTPPGFQREIGVKTQGSSRSISEAGWPLAMASSVALR